MSLRAISFVLAATLISGTAFAQTVNCVEYPNDLVACNNGGDHEFVVKKSKKDELKEILSQQPKFSLGLSLATTNLPDEAFLYEENGVQGEFGALYDNDPTSKTNTANTFSGMNIDFEVRPSFNGYRGLNFGVSSISNLTSDYDGDGTIELTQLPDGSHVVSAVTGERRSYVKNSDESLTGVLLANWVAFAENDIYVLPRTNSMAVFALGVYHAKYETENWAGIASQADGVGYTDAGLQVSMRLVDMAGYSPLKMTVRVGQKSVSAAVGFRLQWGRVARR